MLIQNDIKLLYIEDDEITAKAVNEFFKQAKHTSFNDIHKSTLKEGIEYLESLNCCDMDVILLDLILPNSRGIDTYLSVAKVCPNIPIVIISEHEDVACECVKKGAQDYLLKKELTPGLLIRSLKYAIERTKLEKKFENIVQTSSLGYHLYELKDGELIFVGYNEAANNILRIDNKQFLHRELTDAFPDMTERVINGYKQAVKGTPWINKIVEYGDDNIKHAIFGINAYKSSENQLAVTFSDITDRLKDQEKLKLKEEKFRNLVEVTKAGIYEIDFVNNKFIYVNDVICQQLGYTKEELLEISPFDIITKESVDKWLGRLESLQKGEFIESTVEYKAIRKDGTITWILAASEYIEDENENIIGANVVAIDITERKIAQSIIEDREQAVYKELESKIYEWRKEIDVNNLKKDEQLDLIQSEIISMKSSHEVSI